MAHKVKEVVEDLKRKLSDATAPGKMTQGEALEVFEELAQNCELCADAVREDMARGEG